MINLRSIKPLDRDTIAQSVSKTHHLVSVEEGWPTVSDWSAGAGVWLGGCCCMG